jgi:hypothetical protein
MALYPEGTAPLPLDDVQRAANKANELSRQNLGQNGAIVLASGNLTAPVGTYVALVISTASVISSITAPGITNSTSLTGVSLAAGTTIRGDIRAVTMTSGIAILYKA